MSQLVGISTDCKKLLVNNGGAVEIQSGGRITPASGLHPSAVADATAITGGESPTESEFNSLLAKVNSILAALRGIGVLPTS